MLGRSESVRADFTGPAVGGLITALALFGGVIGVGRIGDFEALRIIEAVLPTTRFLASTAIAASVTVLALLLTLIGLSLTSDMTFHPRLYKRARDHHDSQRCGARVGDGTTARGHHADRGGREPVSTV